MAVKLHQKYEKIWTTEKRYILITGGRGSGKSFAASLYLAEQSYQEQFKALFTRYTMKSANDSVIPEFTSKLDLMQMSSDFHITKEDVINKVSQAQVMFRGIKTASGDQTANLKSLEGVSHFIVDEMEEFKDKERFDTIDLSVRNPFIPNKTICIMNPSNTSHFSYSEWLQNNHRIEVIDGYEVQVSTHPDVEHIHTTWLDNVDNLPKDYIRKLLRIKEETPEYYGYKIIGQYLDSAEGALLKRINTYKPSDLKPESIEGSFAYIDVADEGTDYTVMVIGKIVGAKCYIDDVICDDDNTDVTLPRCIDAARRNKCRNLQVEANSMGAMFGRAIRAALESEGVEVRMVTSTTNKHTRIIMEAPFIQSYMHFRPQTERSAEYANFFRMATQYDKSEKENKDRKLHDDPIDALSGLAKMLRRELSHVFGD
jgi:PBSX family phage terminase large subunit